MQKILLVGIFITLLELVGCTSNKQCLGLEKQNQSIKAIEKQQNEVVWMNEIYDLEDVDYKLYSSRLLDMYMIACALYFDFESDYIMPETDKQTLYKEVKAYFSPYKNHKFISNFGKYVDKEAKDVNGSVVYPLMMYGLSETYYGLGVDEIQTTVFENGKAFNTFLTELKTFYDETNAEAFFENHYLIEKDIDTYISEEIDVTLAKQLFEEMEKEVGKPDESDIHYVGVLSVFRPNMGSAYHMYMGSDTYFVLQASPNGRGKVAQEYDIKMLLNTTIHEFLHLYINDEVATLQEKINQLAQGKTKQDYASSLYNNMPWYRIVDENLVRVIETYLYAQSYEDEEQAYKEILEPEIKAGFYYGDELYKAVKACKEDKAERVIDCIDQLVDTLFKY